MVEIRVIFGDDRENEEFLGFDLDNIEEAEERYTSIRQLDVLNDFDSDIEFSEMGLSDKEEIDSAIDNASGNKRLKKIISRLLFSITVVGPVNSAI
jgi:hypothetical protein